MNKWRPEATQEQIDRVIESLEQLPEQIPELHSVRCIKDIGLEEDDYDFVLFTDFASRADHQAYMSDARHREVLETQIFPILESTARVQYEFDPPS